MIRKYTVLIGIIAALSLLLIAVVLYPGGGEDDLVANNFDWQKNYLCHLFETTTTNGSPNPSRLWAISGMFLLCLSFATFFIHFANKINSENGATVIKYAGAGAMFISFFTVTPLHDLLMPFASTLVLLSGFYVAVFTFQSPKSWLKIIAVLWLFIAYGSNFIYFTQNYLEFLPGLQKVSLGLSVCWVLGLEYFTQKKDFQAIQ